MFFQLLIDLERPSGIEKPFPEFDDTDNHQWNENDLREQHRHTNNRYLETLFLMLHNGSVRGLLYPLTPRGHNEMTAEERSCKLPATNGLKLPIFKIYDEEDIFSVKKTIKCCVCNNPMELIFVYNIVGLSSIRDKKKDDKVILFIKRFSKQLAHDSCLVIIDLEETSNYLFHIGIFAIRSDVETNEFLVTLISASVLDSLPGNLCVIGMRLLIYDVGNGLNFWNKNDTDIINLFILFHFEMLLPMIIIYCSNKMRIERRNFKRDMKEKLIIWKHNS